MPNDKRSTLRLVCKYSRVCCEFLHSDYKLIEQQLRPRGEDGRGEVAPQVLLIVDQSGACAGLARGRCMSSWHDLARELRAVGFNLDKRAQAIGVSRDWVAVAQDRDMWRRVVSEGSCSCAWRAG